MNPIDRLTERQLIRWAVDHLQCARATDICARLDGWPRPTPIRCGARIVLPDVTAYFPSPAGRVAGSLAMAPDGRSARFRHEGGAPEPGPLVVLAEPTLAPTPGGAAMALLGDIREAAESDGFDLWMVVPPGASRRWIDALNAADLPGILVRSPNTSELVWSGGRRTGR